MPTTTPATRRWRRHLGLRLAAVSASVSVIAVAGLDATAQAAPRRADDGAGLQPGNLLISRSVFAMPSITPGVTLLPPGCVPKNCVKANHDGTFPGIWDDGKVDSSFGVTSSVYLDQIAPLGLLIGTLGPRRRRPGHDPVLEPGVGQVPGPPTPVGNFNITELGLPPDKIGKDDNFRGLTISNNVLYDTKGSGGNGVNTVYFVEHDGHRLPPRDRARRARRDAPERAVHLQREDRPPEQHVHPQGLQHRPGQDVDRLVSLRDLVRRRPHRLRRRRGQWRHHLLSGHRDIHR